MPKHTYLEVKRQIAELEKQAERLRKEEAAEVLARIRDAIAVYNFTAADLGFSSTGRAAPQARAGRKRAARPRKVHATPKYQDGQGNTWSGRGPRPAWFKAALRAGKTAEELKV